MSGETGTSSASDRPAAARWIARRIIAAVATGFVVLTVCDLLAQFRWFDDVRSSLRNTWFVDMHMNVQWGIVFLSACAVGFLVPAVKISEKLKRVLISGLVGMPLALVVFGALDAVLAHNAVERAFAPTEEIESELPVFLRRPRPGRRYYPSFYNDRLYWFSSPVVGLITGLQIGAAWAFSRRKRKMLLMSAAFTVVVWFIALTVALQGRYNAMVDHVHTRIEQHLDQH